MHKILIAFFSLTVPAWGQSIPTADAQSEIETIVKNGTPIFGYLTSIVVKIDKCILRREKIYSRICGTAFDSSIVVNETQVVDFSHYSPPFYDKINNTIVIEPRNEIEQKNSFQLKRTCNGYFELENNISLFVKEPNDASSEEIKHHLEALRKYMSKFCDKGN